MHYLTLKVSVMVDHCLWHHTFARRLEPMGDDDDLRCRVFAAWVEQVICLAHGRNWHVLHMEGDCYGPHGKRVGHHGIVRHCVANDLDRYHTSDLVASPILEGDNNGKV